MAATVGWIVSNKVGSIYETKYEPVTSITGSSTDLQVPTAKSVWSALTAVVPTTATANYVYAGPATGSPAAPAFRALVNADIPTGITRTKLATGTADHVLINDGSGGISSEAQLAISRGGTGAASTTQNYVFAGPASGGAGSPLFRALVAADLGTTLEPTFAVVNTPIVKATTSAGLQLRASNDAVCVTFGAGGGCNAAFGDGATFSGTVNATHAGGVQTQAAATQDAIRMIGRAGGTGTYIGTLTPTTLTASRTWTFPNAAIVVAGSASALTDGRLPRVTTGGLLQDTDISIGAADGIISRTGNIYFGTQTAGSTYGIYIYGYKTGDAARSAYLRISPLYNDTAAIGGTTYLAVDSLLMPVTQTASMPASNDNPLVFRTGATGSGIFAEAGHLVLMPRTSLARDIVFVGGTSPAEIARFDMSAGALLIGTTAPIGSARVRFAGGTEATATANDLVFGAGVLSIGGRLRQAGCFAEIHCHDASTAQAIATGATYTKLTAFTDNGASANCTADAANDKITLTKTGYYRVSFSASFTCASNNVVWKCAAFLNGTEQDNCHWERKIATGADIGNASFCGIIDSTATNLDLDVRLAHDQGGSENVTIKYANLNVEYIGET